MNGRMLRAFGVDQFTSATTLRIVYRVAVAVFSSFALTIAPAIANACKPSPRPALGCTRQ